MQTTATSEIQESESSLSDCLPKHFSKKEFGNTEFRNRETERVAQHIVAVQRSANSEQWTPFDWDSYHRGGKRGVVPQEKDILEALVEGGIPVIGCTSELTGGYLKRTRNGGYMVTKKFIDAIRPFKD